MPTQKIIYKGNVIDERDVNGNPAVIYNGKIIGDVLVDKPRTLQTEKKVAKTNIMIGSAILACEGKAITDDIEITLELSADPILENNSWEMISDIAQSGEAANIWSIGDTRSIVLSGEEYTAQIVGFDHYDVDDPTTYGREKAGIVFQFKDVIESLLSCSDTRAYADDWITNYCDCSEFVPSIKFPKRLYSNNYKVGEAVAKGIGASEMELLGTYSNEGAQVGTQFAFYAAGNSRVKYSKGTTTKREWWTRSLSGTSAGNYVYINTSGNSAKASNSNTKRCAPVFCL